MQWQRRFDTWLSKFALGIYLVKLSVFDAPLRRVETIKIRSGLKPDCGFDVVVWQRNGHWYFHLVHEFHGGFPHDWEYVENSTEISPATYIDLMGQYVNLFSYIERLNTGEAKPGSFSAWVEDLTPDPQYDIKLDGE